MFKNLFYLLIISLLLSSATHVLMGNTIPFREISDADRYKESITQGVEARFGVSLLAPLTWVGDFAFNANFIFILIIGYLIHSSTNSWKITMLALLGFSVSLMLYFSLLAQMVVIAMALGLWTKVDAFDMKHAIRNHAIYLAAGLFMALTHKFGLALWLLIYLVKAIRNHSETENKVARIAAVISFLAASACMLIGFFQATERVSFYYFFLLPMSLGAFDMLYWLGLFSAILWMLLKCENNTSELIAATIIFIGVIANYLFVSHLEIDAWRILIFFELIALVRIGQSKQAGKLITWAPWFLILMGLQRIILGLWA